MNIAILTQPLCNNYGGILQNYALQTILERSGHRVTTLNFPVSTGYSGGNVRHILSICRRCLQKLGGAPDVVWVDLAKESRKQVELARLIGQFCDKHLHLVTTQAPITSENTGKLGFDAFVVGSDQVWRPRYNKHYLENMFLDFTDGMDVKRYAYAASFGTDAWEYSQEQSYRCATLAGLFDAISVREESGVELCKRHFGVDATSVLDPTLLLNAGDYMKLCSGNEHPDGNYLAIYSLDYTRDKMNMYQEISRTLKVPLHYIGRFTKKGYPSVESWLEGIANAKYVITDSFHGTVFSIIFRKQFVALGNAARGNSRFESLFSSLWIPEERLCCSSREVVTALQTALDYDEIALWLERKRKVSRNFLDRIKD